MMTDTEVLAQLEALGTEQTRKTWRRHGIGENQYGVSYGDMGKLKKKISSSVIEWRSELLLPFVTVAGM